MLRSNLILVCMMIVGSTYPSKICSCKSATDLTFIIDPTASDFTTVRNFIISVINWFDLGQNLTRVAVVTSDEYTSNLIYLNQYYSRLSLYSAVTSIVADSRGNRLEPFNIVYCICGDRNSPRSM